MLRQCVLGKGNALVAVPTTRVGDVAVPADDSLQKFASVRAPFHNHFSQERHLVDRQTYRNRRSVALAEWQNLLA